MELPPPVQSALKAHLDALSSRIPTQPVRWVDPASIHLTLKFLGDVTAVQLEQVKIAAQRAAESSSVLSLQTARLGCFPHFQRPKVIWVDVQGQRDRLMALRDCVENEIAPLGFPTEERAFSPHLTLGRVKTNERRLLGIIGYAVQEAQGGEAVQWENTHLCVMQSTLTPSGAVYTALATFSLKS